MAVIAMNAQNSKRTSAWNYLKYGKLDKAKEAIDAASEHPKTMKDAKTWFYRGNVYLSIQLSDEEKYKELDPDALDKSYDAYITAMELDKKGEFTKDVNDRILVCAEQYYNKGVNKFNEKNYEEAMKSFEKAGKVNKSLGKIDTLATYNAALCAEFADFSDNAKINFEKLVEWNYDQPVIYSSLSEIYETDGDTLKAIEIVKKGREKYPENFNLIITEINIYLAIGEQGKAMELLKMAIEQDDTNPTIFFAVGTNYDQMGNFEEAENAYLRAIELKDDYFDANYNIGALYVNKAIEIQEKANSLPLDAQEKYDKMNNEANELFKKSLPYLEKADQIQPGDVYTLRTLKDIYTRLNMQDKVLEINEKINQ